MFLLSGRVSDPLAGTKFTVLEAEMMMVSPAPKTVPGFHRVGSVKSSVPPPTQVNVAIGCPPSVPEINRLRLVGVV
jgi:hypothetical protein